MKFILMVLGVVLFTSNVVALGANCARTSVLAGRVTNAQGKRLKVGDPIASGQSVQTDKNSLAKFLLLDDSIIDVGPETMFRFSDCKSTTVSSINLELELGSVRAAVNKKPLIPREKFEIRTRSSVLAVRGTELFASWQQNASGLVEEQIGVKEGMVEVTSLFDPKSAPIEVGGGQQFSQEARIEETSGKEVKVVPLDPPKVDQFTASEQRKVEDAVKIEDKVFEQSVQLPEAKKDDASTNSGKEARSFIFETITGEKRATQQPVMPTEGTTEARNERNHQGDREIASNRTPSPTEPRTGTSGVVDDPNRRATPTPGLPTAGGATPIFGTATDSSLPRPDSWEDSGFKAGASPGNVPFPGTATGTATVPGTDSTYQPTFIRLEVKFKGN